MRYEEIKQQLITVLFPNAGRLNLYQGDQKTVLIRFYADH